MVRYLHYLLGILLLKPLICQNGDLCQNQDFCGDCMYVSAECRWCSAIDFAGRRCNTEANLTIQGCPTEFIINEKTKIEVVDIIETAYYRIWPKNITVKFRANDSFAFSIYVILLEYLPVETAVVLDFSNSMKPVFDELIAITANLTTMGLESGITKFGYAKFVDKTSHPIILPYSYEKTLEASDNPVNYAIIASLSNDSDMLLAQLSQHNISSNLDVPETALDAVIQTVVCPKMGWSTSTNMVKSVIMLTDQDTKIQTDAEMVGIMLPHDLKCHTDAEGFDPHGMEFDYPSVAQTGSVLRDNKADVIFAVDPRVKPNYEEIVKLWHGVNSVVTDLSTGSFDLLSIILDSQAELNSQVGLTYDVTSDLKIMIQPICANFTGTTCSGVNINETVEFGVTVDVLNPASDSSILFYVSSLETIPFSYQAIDECECSKSTTSGDCLNGGTFMCGVCKCVEPYGGSLCECVKNLSVSTALCTNPATGTVCTERGKCDECGICSCYTAPDGLPYEGQYCECGRTQCGMYNGLICGGPERGKCNCNVCECDQKYYGNACENVICDSPEVAQACIPANETVPCSGIGDCLCGTCECPAEWTGTYCEKQSTLVSCATFEDAASCFLSNKSISETFDCTKVNSTIEYATGEYWVCVRIDTEDCKMYYNYTATETSVHLYVKQMVEEEDCAQPVNVAAVTGIVFVCILIAGLIIFGVYMICLFIYYRAEYNNFLKETRRQGEGTTNPLYET